MNKPGIHRHTSTSRAGRSMIKVGRSVSTANISMEVLEWNAQVDQRKREKLQAKLTKATGVPVPRDPVHYDHGKWWFWDETGATALGPYDNEQQARSGLKAYCKMLDTPNDTVSV